VLTGDVLAIEVDNVETPGSRRIGVLGGGFRLSGDGGIVRARRLKRN
jgi:hypothetical protein